MGEGGETAVYLLSSLPGSAQDSRFAAEEIGMILNLNLAPFILVFFHLESALPYSYETLHSCLRLPSGLTQKQFSAKLTLTMWVSQGPSFKGRQVHKHDCISLADENSGHPKGFPCILQK